MAQPSAFNDAISRRWLIIAVAAILLGFSSLTDRIPSLSLLGAFVVASTGLNLFAWLISRNDTTHVSFTIGAFLLDLTIASVAIGSMGSSGLLVGLLAVLLPYTLHSSVGMAACLLAITSVSYAASLMLHGLYVALPARTWYDIPAGLAWDVGLFVFVVMALRFAHAKRNARILGIRAQVQSLEEAQAEPNFPDEISALDYSVRALRERFASTATAASKDAGIIATFATVVCDSAKQAHEANATLVRSSSAMIDGLEIQKQGAEAGERRSATAVEYAREIGEQATAVAGGIETLLHFVEAARAQIQQSHDSLRSIEYDVEGALQALTDLATTTTATSETLRGVLGFARQAHVLALNTAIKSANGDLSGQTGSDIAGRIRALAADTSGATTDVAHMVDRLHDLAAAIERAMKASQTQTRDALVFTNAANKVLAKLHLAALRSNELAGASVDISRVQAEHLSELSKHLTEVATHRIETTHDVALVSHAIATHRTMIDELEVAGSRLMTTAAQMRHQVSLLPVQTDVPRPQYQNGEKEPQP